MKKDEIRRGYEFSGKEERCWQALAEGQGVVVFPMGTLGYRAYDVAANWGSQIGQAGLRQNLAGANRTFEGRAWLVLRQNGRLIWLNKEQLEGMAKKAKDETAPFKVKRFNEIGGEVYA